MRSWSACRAIPTARRTRIRAARGASRGSCAAASACRCTRSTSATRTTEARERHGPRDLDAAAAAIILEQYLRERTVPEARRRHEHAPPRRRSALRRPAGRRARAAASPQRAGRHLVGRRLARRAPAAATCSCAGAHGVICSALHRDDFGSRGLAAGADHTDCRSRSKAATSCWSTTSSTPAAPSAPSINELYDFGRPASVALAVLVDRGGRELPIERGLLGGPRHAAAGAAPARSRATTPAASASRSGEDRLAMLGATQPAAEPHTAS